MSQASLPIPLSPASPVSPVPCPTRLRPCWQAYDFLTTVAEPVSRPECIHEYRLTPQSLYTAVSVGLDPQTILRVLGMLSKVRQASQPLPGWVPGSRGGSAAAALQACRLPLPELCSCSHYLPHLCAPSAGLCCSTDYFQYA